MLSCKYPNIFDSLLANCPYCKQILKRTPNVPSEYELYNIDSKLFAKTEEQRAIRQESEAAATQRRILELRERELFFDSVREFVISGCFLHWLDSYMETQDPKTYPVLLAIALGLTSAVKLMKLEHAEFDLRNIEDVIGWSLSIAGACWGGQMSEPSLVSQTTFFSGLFMMMLSVAKRGDRAFNVPPLIPDDCELNSSWFLHSVVGNSSGQQ
jgi:hypothetical protein